MKWITSAGKLKKFWLKTRQKKGSGVARPVTLCGTLSGFEDGGDITRAHTHIVVGAR